jgi:hypothetical protein
MAINVTLYFIFQELVLAPTPNFAKDYWAVERIEDTRIVNGKKEHLLKFVNYDERHNEWYVNFVVVLFLFV